MHDWLLCLLLKSVRQQPHNSVSHTDCRATAHIQSVNVRHSRHLRWALFFLLTLQHVAIFGEHWNTTLVSWVETTVWRPKQRNIFKCICLRSLYNVADSNTCSTATAEKPPKLDSAFCDFIFSAMIIFWVFFFFFSRLFGHLGDEQLHNKQAFYLTI